MLPFHSPEDINCNAEARQRSLLKYCLKFGSVIQLKDNGILLNFVNWFVVLWLNYAPCYLNCVPQRWIRLNCISCCPN